MSVMKTMTIKSKHDGLPLSVLTILPEGEIRGLVQFSHGMAENKERYIPLMEYLADKGYGCMINDHRGHGASVREKTDLGYFYKDGANGLLKDLNMLTRRFKEAHPGLPLVLVGHSMGSLAARAYAARYGDELAGLVLSGSPGQNAAAKAGLVLTKIMAIVHGGDKAVSPMMVNMVSGGFAKRFPEDGEFGWLSVNKQNVADYEASPLCGFPFTINGYRALLALMIAAYDPKTAIRKDLPVHFMSGADDPCAPDRKGFDDAVANIRSRGCANVTSKMYDGLRHEIFNEGVAEVWEDLKNVLDGMFGA
ncbi:MAG: lysophospholipase [Clostridia bacterium]|nr:lysophospholipase [Clostridia bacterium]